MPAAPDDGLTESDASRGKMRDSAPADAVAPVPWRLVTIRAGIAVYWLAMFLATHLPVQQVIDRLPASDKHLHLIAYGALGLVLPWWGRNPSRGDGAQRRSKTLSLYLLIVAYAALDEWLQIPVGRMAEWGDWFADAAGALLGVSAGTWIRNYVARSRIR